MVHPWFIQGSSMVPFGSYVVIADPLWSGPALSLEPDGLDLGAVKACEALQRQAAPMPLMLLGSDLLGCGTDVKVLVVLWYPIL